MAKTQKLVYTELPKDLLVQVEHDKKEIERRERKIHEVRESAVNMRLEASERKTVMLERSGNTLQNSKEIKNKEIAQILVDIYRGYISRGHIYRLVAEKHRNWTRQFNTESTNWQEYQKDRITSVNSYIAPESRSEMQLSEEDKEQAANYNAFADYDKRVIDTIDYLIELLTGMSLTQRGEITNSATNSTNARRLLAEKSREHRFKILKRQNAWALKNFIGRSHELRYLIDDWTDQLDKELELAKAKQEQYGK